jgi:hypothetical protein
VPVAVVLTTAVPLSSTHLIVPNSGQSGRLVVILLRAPLFDIIRYRVAVLPLPYFGALPTAAIAADIRAEVRRAGPVHLAGGGTIRGVSDLPADLRGPVSLVLAVAQEVLPAPAALVAGAIYEVKWDGFRCAAVHQRCGVRLWSRRGRAALVTRDVSRPVASVRTSFRPFLAHAKRSWPDPSDLRLREPERRPKTLPGR